MTVSVSTARWTPEVFGPWPHSPGALLARVAARSAAFAGTGAAGGAPVLIGSAAGADPGDVRRRARGELMERMGNVLAGRSAEAEAARARPGATPGIGEFVHIGDWCALRRHGVPAVDPAAWSGRDDSRDVRQLWCRGRSTGTGEEVWVPAGTAFLQHRPPPGCTVTHRAGSTGVATHPDPAAAAAHAAWEILERDLVRRSWCAPHLRPPVSFDPRAALPADADADVVRKLLDREALTAVVLALPAPAGVVAVAVCLHDPDGAHQTFGARCAPAGEGRDAVVRACWEALMVRWSMATPVARRGWDRLARTRVPRSGLDHALWAYRAQDALAHWTGSRAPVHSPDPAVPSPELDPFARVEATASPSPTALLADHTGEDVIAVERAVGPPADEGLAVVRLVAPGSLPLPTGPRPGVPPHPFG